MECVQTIEKIIEGDSLTLKKLKIGDKEYSLVLGNKDGRLSLGFNEGEPDKNGSDYQIIIEEEGIRFARYARRPNHDHSDEETLQIVVDETKDTGLKNGTIRWRSRFPYQNEGYRFYYIPFGAVTREY